MKIICIIILITALENITSLTNINDISLSTEYPLNSKEFPNNIFPIDSVFYFRLEVSDKNEKKIQLRADKKDSFIVKIVQSAEKAEIEDVAEEQWDYLESQKERFDSKYYLHFYYLEPEENAKYILISVALKKDLKFFSFYIENEEPLIDKITAYKAKYLTEYKVNQRESKHKYPKFIIEIDGSHIGETFLNFVVNHNDTPVDFRLFGIGHELDSDKFTNIDLHDITEPGNSIYKSTFNLDKINTKMYISVEMDKKIDFSFYLNHAINDTGKIPNIYSIDFDEYTDMNDAVYSSDRSRYIILNLKSGFTGNVSILLKVNKSALNNNFEIDAYGTEKLGGSNKKYLDVKFNRTYSEGNYKIIQYDFKSDEKTSFFTIYVNVQNYEGYLSMKVNKIIIKDNSNAHGNKKLPKQESDEFEDSVKLGIAILIFFCCFLFFCCLIIYGICNGNKRRRRICF